MAALLPNLDDLLAALPDTEAGRDAAVLAAIAAGASSWSEAAPRLDAMVRTWAAQ